MFSVNLKDAYFQTPILPEYCSYPRFTVAGKIYQCKMLCFSRSIAPQLFTHVFILESMWVHQLVICSFTILTIALSLLGPCPFCFAIRSYSFNCFFAWALSSTGGSQTWSLLKGLSILGCYWTQFGRVCTPRTLGSTDSRFLLHGFCLPIIPQPGYGVSTSVTCPHWSVF